MFCSSHPLCLGYLYQNTDTREATQPTEAIQPKLVGCILKAKNICEGDIPFQ